MNEYIYILDTKLEGKNSAPNYSKLLTSIFFEFLMKAILVFWGYSQIFFGFLGLFPNIF